MPVLEEGKRKATTNQRLQARISREKKALCQKAAILQGSSLSDFVINSAVEAARRTIQENEFLTLTRRDRLAFAEALLNAAPPNAKLQKAAARHSQVLPG